MTAWEDAVRVLKRAGIGFAGLFAFIIAVGLIAGPPPPRPPKPVVERHSDVDKAVQEYFERRALQPLLNRAVRTARIADLEKARLCNSYDRSIDALQADQCWDELAQMKEERSFDTKTGEMKRGY